MKKLTTNKLIILQRVMIAISITGLTACSTFTSPKEQPVIEDKIGQKFGTLAVTAERRIVIFGRENNDPQKMQICAEPSPDVAESISSTLKALAQAKVKTGDTDANASLEASKAFATAISNLFVRSQGIQYLRDSMYALCQAKMNGMYTEKEVKTIFEQILANSKDLIHEEIPKIETLREEHAAGRAEQANGEAQKRATEAKASADAASESATKADSSAKTAKTDAATAAAKAKEATDAATKAGDTK